MRSPGLPRSTPVADLRVETDLLNRINPITSVQSLLQKYSGFQKDQIGCMSFAVPSPKGALAIVTDAGRDAMDADGAFDEQR
jgi:hypothetical protein